MKQKAFTLTELLGVIVIVGILLILIVPSVINRLSNSGNKTKDTENELIYNAADQYIREHPSEYPPGKSGRYCITIQSLIDDGKLVAPVTDVNTGKDITNLSVMVTIYSTGNADHELKAGEECEEIAALPMIDFKVDPRGSSWVKQRKVTIIYPSIEGNFEASHRIDGDSWIRDSSADKGGNVELTFTKTSKLEARLIGSDIISSKINIVNIDSEAPKITNVAMGSWNNGTNDIKITAQDDISGLDGLYISTSSTKPSETDSSWISVSSDPGKSKTFTRNLEIGTYYIWVKDKAGNISSSNTSLEVLDQIKPTCSITDTGTKGDNGWYVGDVTLKMTTSDKESEVTSYGMNTSNSATYNGITQMTLTSDRKSVTYYGFVKDSAGNVGTCSKTVKRDATPPSCVSSGGSTTWKNKNVTLKGTCSDDTSDCVDNITKTIKKEGTFTKQTPGTVKDKAGNTTSCPANQTVKIDKTAPSNITISGNPGCVNKPKTFKLKLKATEKGSGIKKWQYGYRKSSSSMKDYANSDSTTFTTPSFSDVSNRTIYFRACDKANNCSGYKSSKICIQSDPDKNYTSTCKKICRGYGCGIKINGKYVYYNDSVYKWSFSRAGSGIDKSTMKINYSTEHVSNFAIYTPSNAPWGLDEYGYPRSQYNQAGYAYFTSNAIQYSRSYARSVIVGYACTKSGKCSSCDIRES